MDTMNSGGHVDTNREMNPAIWPTMRDYKHPPNSLGRGLHKLSLPRACVEVSALSSSFLSNSGLSICMGYSRDPSPPHSAFYALSTEPMSTMRLRRYCSYVASL